MRDNHAIDIRDIHKLNQWLHHHTEGTDTKYSVFPNVFDKTKLFIEISSGESYVRTMLNVIVLNQGAGQITEKIALHTLRAFYRKLSEGEHWP